MGETCIHCNQDMYRYGITFEDEDYIVNLCWLDGYFKVSPEVLDTFTYSIIRNPSLILELIKDKRLKAV